ncbi:hypothetical protein ACSS6W_001959 [Trichoderma asperelloides]
MLLLRLLVAVLFHLPVVLSMPYFPTHLGLRDGNVATNPPVPPTTIPPSIPPSLPPPSTTPIPIPTTTADYWREMCKPGAECDCTRIKDKNGEEYFQCVTNPRCDHCWINLTATTTTTTRPLPFTSVTPVTNFLRTDYQTLLPGTYTSSSSGTAHVVIVQQPSQSISISVVTATMTNLVTISVIPFCGASFGGSTATASPSVDFQPGVEWKR